MAIVIDIKLNTQGAKTSAIQKTVNDLKRLEAQTDRCNQKLLVMNSILNSINGMASRLSMPSMPRGGGGGGYSGGFKGPKPPTMSQQFREHFDAFKFFDNIHKRTGGKQGGAARAAALANAHSSAQHLAGAGKFGAMNALLPHIMPKQRMGLMGALKSAFMTSRFSASGKGIELMPLVGKTLQALSNLHPVVKGVVLALTVLASGAAAAGRAMAQFSSDRAALHGSPGQTAAAVRAVNSLGMGDAKSVAEAIRGGSAGEAAAAGINTAYGPYGNNNYAEIVLKAFNHVARSVSLDQANRRSEKLGIPDAAKLYFLNARHKAELARDAAGNFGINDSQARTSTNSSFAWNRAMDRYKMEFTKSMEWVIVGFGQFGDFLNGYLDWVEDIRRKLGITPASDHAKAVKDNTKATQELNRTMREATEYYGGGARVRSSMPEKLNSINRSDASVRAALGNGVPI